MDDAVRVYQGGSVLCNGYLIEGKDGFIAIDAPEGFAEWILARRPDAKVTDLLITHMHYDHVEGAAKLKETFGCKIHAHSAYNDKLTLSKLAKSAWGIQLEIAEFIVDDVFGDDCKLAEWGAHRWFIHHIPGHSSDGVAFHLPDEHIMFVGDILFAGSVGRTDLPGGNLALLQRGIHERLFNQDAHTVVYPGHGPYTTISTEILSNPYLS